MQISALIPTYNRRTQVMQAIDSVLAQTVPIEEIIVVDDGSTDGTVDAIHKRYGSRVSLFYQENSGVSAARNRGIRESRGEWIAFLDSDDIWFPNKIERQIEALNMFGEEYGLCFTDCVYQGNPKLTMSVFEETGFRYSSTFGAIEDPRQFILAGNEPFWTQSLLVHRSLFSAGDGFDEALTVREDTDMMFRLSFVTRFCFVAEPLVRIDRNPSRRVGLCELYASRDDQKYRNLQRLYTRWLEMREVTGGPYQGPIRERLKATYYDSTEAKLHDLRLMAAFHEINQLRTMGDGYWSIASKLYSRKMEKLWRRARSRNSRRQRTAQLGEPL